MGIGPTVVEDGADELVDVEFAEVLVELVDDKIEPGVYDQELDHVDGREPDHLYGQEPGHTDGDGLV